MKKEWQGFKEAPKVDIHLNSQRTKLKNVPN